MTMERVTMRKTREVLRLKYTQSFSNSQIGTRPVEYVHVKTLPIFRSFVVQPKGITSNLHIEKGNSHPKYIFLTLPLKYFSYLINGQLSR